MKKIPQRHCIGCRISKSKFELLRIVRNKDGNISLDATGKKPGRGAYICRDISCFKKARKNNALEKVFEAYVPGEIYDMLEQELAGEVDDGA